MRTREGSFEKRILSFVCGVNVWQDLSQRVEQRRLTPSSLFGLELRIAKLFQDLNKQMVRFRVQSTLLNDGSCPIRFSGWPQQLVGKSASGVCCDPKSVRQDDGYKDVHRARRIIKPNEFENFDRVMDELLKVLPKHIREKLEEERQAKAERRRSRKSDNGNLTTKKEGLD
jgi:hypothetical protein